MMEDIHLVNFKHGLSDQLMIEQRDDYFVDPNEFK